MASRQTALLSAERNLAPAQFLKVDEAAVHDDGTQQHGAGDEGDDEQLQDAQQQEEEESSGLMSLVKEQIQVLHCATLHTTCTQVLLEYY